MRLMVFFDLPVTTKAQRREATRFRNFLLKDGYYMLQFSVYVRICNGSDNINLHRRRLKANVPDNGSVRSLVITEKQYESIDLVLGTLRPEEEKPPVETLTLF